MNINVGLLNLLTIVFVVLKLVGVIAWSWLLVLLPTIIWLTIIVLFISSLLSLVNRLVKKVETETNNQDKSAEDLFKEIEKNLKKKR